MELVARRVARENLSRVGVIATQPAMEMALYENVAETVVYADDSDTLMDAMYLYKAGEKERAIDKYTTGVESIAEEVDGYVVGCTDFSALSSPLAKTTIDALEVLVDWCVNRFA
jgi:aspartate/glutamate racemase